MPTKDCNFPKRKLPKKSFTPENVHLQTFCARPFHWKPFYNFYTKALSPPTIYARDHLHCFLCKESYDFVHTLSLKLKICYLEIRTTLIQEWSEHELVIGNPHLADIIPLRRCGCKNTAFRTLAISQLRDVLHNCRFKLLATCCYCATSILLFLRIRNFDHLMEATGWLGVLLEPRLELFIRWWTLSPRRDIDTATRTSPALAPKVSTTKLAELTKSLNEFIDCFLLSLSWLVGKQCPNYLELFPSQSPVSNSGSSGQACSGGKKATGPRAVKDETVRNGRSFESWPN